MEALLIILIIAVLAAVVVVSFKLKTHDNTTGNSLLVQQQLDSLRAQVADIDGHFARMHRAAAGGNRQNEGETK